MKRSSLPLLAVALAAFGGPVLATERLPTMTPSEMTPAQKEISDKIMASRHTLGGAFHVWVRSPEMADRLQAVGEYLRFRPDLPKAMLELAVMTTAAEWHTQFEFSAHYRNAIEAGIKRDILVALADGRRPEGMTDDEAMVYDFSHAMHHDHGRVSDALFEKVRKRLGDQGVVDLIGLNAYYAVAVMTINATDQPTPPNANKDAPLLKPLP
jgi:4-carboxymuconolactone decarboxylase